jgi:hypothetical protein
VNGFYEFRQKVFWNSYNLKSNAEFHPKIITRKLFVRHGQNFCFHASQNTEKPQLYIVLKFVTD